MTRNELDFYETPPWKTFALLDYSPIQIEGSVLDLTAGRAAIASVLKKERPDLRVKTNDLNPEYRTHYSFDARNLADYPQESFDWVITNPPYWRSEEIVRPALEFARKGVALLLRSSWAELTPNRFSLLRQIEPTIINVSRRYCWRKGKEGRWDTDWVGNWWFVWSKESTKRTQFIWTDYNLRGYTRDPDQTAKQYPGFPWTEEFYGKDLESRHHSVHEASPLVLDHRR